MNLESQRPYPAHLTLAQLAHAAPCLTDIQLQKLWVQAHKTNTPPPHHHYCIKRGGLYHIVRAKDRSTRGFRVSYPEALSLAQELSKELSND